MPGSVATVVDDRHDRVRRAAIALHELLQLRQIECGCQHARHGVIGLDDGRHDVHRERPVGDRNQNIGNHRSTCPKRLGKECPVPDAADAERRIDRHLNAAVDECARGIEQVHAPYGRVDLGEVPQEPGAVNWIGVGHERCRESAGRACVLLEVFDEVIARRSSSVLELGTTFDFLATRQELAGHGAEQQHGHDSGEHERVEGVGAEASRSASKAIDK